jgi:hypothetical protein
MEILFSVLLPLAPFAALWGAARHGPIRSRWWRGETPIGFALFVGSLAFLAGFVGPMVLRPSANQGPLLGIFVTGPIGLAVGLAWGLLRARRRCAFRARS